MLQQLESLPDGLLDAGARDLDGLLGAPTLIHLPGARQPALFVSVLMHGNETVGWDAIRGLLLERLARFGEPRLPRALSLFIGNVSAAASGVRRDIGPRSPCARSVAPAARSQGSRCPRRSIRRSGLLRRRRGVW